MAIEKWNLTIFSNADGTRGYHTNQNKLIRERQLSYDLTHMWNLKNKTEDHKGKEEKIKQEEIREGDKP